MSQTSGAKAIGVQLALVLTAIWAAGCEKNPSSSGQSSSTETIAPGVAAGQTSTRVPDLYVTHCAACHGIEGHGDGPAAEQLFPKPRAFRDSPLRFAATGRAGSEVLGAIEQTIRQGVRRSAMPGFDGILTNDEIKSLAQYVYEITPSPPAYTGPTKYEFAALLREPKPPFDDWVIQQGRRLYQNLACANCHGDSGHGDGPEMQRLVDSQGVSMYAADLASGLYKSGARPEDLFRAILYGVPGTPMVSYSSFLLEEQPHGTNPHRAWALVAYVMSLASRHTLEGTESGAQIVVQEVDEDALFLHTSHSEWLNVPSTVLTLRPVWQRPEETIALSVAAVRSGGNLGIHVVWDDATMNINKDTAEFPDGVAVMFAMTDEAPALPMGVEVEGHTALAEVNIWNWKADRQFDASAGRRHDALDPRHFPPSNYHDFSLSLPPTAPPATVATEFDQDLRRQDTLFITAASTGNVHADPSLTIHGTLEANAKGFGSLRYQSTEQQGVLSSAVWSNGHWFVTMFRQVTPGGENDVNLRVPRRIPVAFAVWNGAKGDRNGVKLISAWHWLVIE